MKSAYEGPKGSSNGKEGGRERERENTVNGQGFTERDYGESTRSGQGFTELVEELFLGLFGGCGRKFIRIMWVHLTSAGAGVYGAKGGTGLLVPATAPNGEKVHKIEYGEWAKLNGENSELVDFLPKGYSRVSLQKGPYSKGKDYITGRGLNGGRGYKLKGDYDLTSKDKGRKALENVIRGNSGILRVEFEELPEVQVALRHLAQLHLLQINFGSPINVGEREDKEVVDFYDISGSHGGVWTVQKQLDVFMGILPFATDEQIRDIQSRYERAEHTEKIVRVYRYTVDTFYAEQFGESMERFRHMYDYICSIYTERMLREQMGDEDSLENQEQMMKNELENAEILLSKGGAGSGDTIMDMGGGGTVDMEGDASMLCEEDVVKGGGGRRG
jgi:hypothetical protein